MRKCVKTELHGGTLRRDPTAGRCAFEIAGTLHVRDKIWKLENSRIQSFSKIENFKISKISNLKISKI